MTNPSTSETPIITCITAPEQSDWQCELFGMGPTGMVLRPKKGSEPNWFWRWMQYLCFGNKWVKVSRFDPKLWGWDSFGKEEAK